MGHFPDVIIRGVRMTVSTPAASLVSVLSVLAILGAAAAGCSSGSVSQDPQTELADEVDGVPALSPAAGPTEEEWFTDRAEAVGLDFVHFNGMTGKFYQPEIMGPGVGLFDYDNDGDLDVYLVQGQMLGTGTALLPLPSGLPLTDRLYRNDLDVDGDGTTLQFTDVTAESGIIARGHGMGVATGDIDNDGWVDLYLTGFGRNQMFRNNEDGTFADVSSQTGTDDPAGYGVPTSFFDFDRDGWLDLFVGNYLDYSLETHITCHNRSGPPDYCPPEVYRAQPNRLYRNRADGTFVDVTRSAGVARDFGPALGVATADFDNDGWIDIFVANDQQENQLWMNQNDGTFMNLALLSGAALGARAASEDGTVPPLTLDRVWVTPAGRARLLDWSAPGAEPTGHPPEHGSELDTIERFLANVTTWCLTSGPGGERSAALPLGAHRLVGRLARADLCVQIRYVCSVGMRPTGGRARGPVAWIAARRETE